jgi:hypothetical protein
MSYSSQLSTFSTQIRSDGFGGKVKLSFKLRQKLGVVIAYLVLTSRVPQR